MKQLSVLRPPPTEGEATMEIVVTGAPRSGTLYLARLLGWAHESHYRPGGSDGPAPTPEVSWFAAPYVDPTRTLIVHLVRDPFACVASNIHRGWYQPANDWAAIAYAHVGTWDPWEFWLRWTDICAAKAHTTIRLEDIAHLGPPVNQSDRPTPATPPARLEADLAAAAARYGYRWPDEGYEDQETSDGTGDDPGS